MLLLLLPLTILAAAEPTAPDPAPPAAEASAPADAADPFAAAIARHPWRWFGLTRTAAHAQATAQGLTLAEEGAKGTVEVRWHGDRILHARHGGLTEGTPDPALLPWLGLTEAAAQALAAPRPWRVVSRDGEHFPVTMDFRAERLNAHVVTGVVVAVSGG